MVSWLAEVGSVAGDGQVCDGLGLGHLGSTSHDLSFSNGLVWPCSHKDA